MFVLNAITINEYYEKIKMIKKQQEKTIYKIRDINSKENEQF